MLERLGSVAVDLRAAGWRKQSTEVLCFAQDDKMNGDELEHAPGDVREQDGLIAVPFSSSLLQLHLEHVAVFVERSAVGIGFGDFERDWAAADATQQQSRLFVAKCVL